MKRIAAASLALFGTPLLSAGCNAILGIDDHKITSPSDAASDAWTAHPDVGIDVESGSPFPRDGATDADEGAAAPDARDARETGADVGDGGSIGDSGSSGDGGPIGSDGGDAGIPTVVLRGTISTMKLAPAAAGNVRLVDHGIAVPWKSCNASNCVSGGIAP